VINVETLLFEEDTMKDRGDAYQQPPTYRAQILNARPQSNNADIKGTLADAHFMWRATCELRIKVVAASTRRNGLIAAGGVARRRLENLISDIQLFWRTMRSPLPIFDMYLVLCTFSKAAGERGSSFPQEFKEY
jgi:hypothetical protein